MHSKRPEPAKNKETIQSTKSIQNKILSSSSSKWELLADEKVRHTFASKVAFLFRELPEYNKDVETKWDLFKSEVITSAAVSCGCKRVGSPMGNEKRTAW